MTQDRESQDRESAGVQPGAPEIGASIGPTTPFSSSFISYPKGGASVKGLRDAFSASLLEAALEYASRGWAVHPLHPGTKRPCTEHGLLDATDDEATIRGWWQQWPDANIGVACGPSGLVIIDLDAKTGGAETWTSLQKLHRLEDAPVRGLTGGGGEHLYYQAPEGAEIRNSAGLLGPGIDVRGAGGYVVAPPSLHESGRQYAWDVEAHPDDHDLRPLPPTLVALLTSPGPAPKVEGEIREGTRNTTLTSLAGSMRWRGMSQEAIEDALLTENRLRCKPPLSNREVLTIARSVARYEPEAEVKRDDLALRPWVIISKRSETRETRIVPPALADHLMTEAHYLNLTTTLEPRLLVYRNGAYRPGGDVFLREACKSALGDDFRTRHLTEVLACVETATRRSPGEADSHLDLLNCKNGMVNWQSGKILPHSPEYLSSVQFPINYRPEARCPAIEKFLNEVLPADCIAPILELVGYLLLPDTSLEIATMLEGAGANGKSTLMGVVDALLGPENVSHIPLQALGENRFAAAQLEGRLANLFPDLDARLIKTSGTFKALVSGDPIMAERKFGVPFSLRPYARLIFSCNRLPRSWDTSEAFFRRWLIIAFPNSFEGERADTKLLGKLTTEDELSGLLNLAIKGLRTLTARGRFVKPETAKKALQEYRLQSDPALSFLAEQCTTEAEGKADLLVGKDALYAAYRTFCEAEGIYPDSRRAFNKRFQDLYPEAKEWRPRGQERLWRGAVRLLPEYEKGPKQGQLAASNDGDEDIPF